MIVPWNKAQSYSLIEADTEGEEEFSEGDTGINVTEDDNVSSFVEVTDDVLDFDSALHFCDKMNGTFLRSAHDNDAVVLEPVVVFELDGGSFLVGEGDFDFIVFGFVVAGTGEEGDEPAVGVNEVSVVDNEEDSVGSSDEVDGHEKSKE